MDTTTAISGFLGRAADDLTDERKADLARVAGRIGELYPADVLDDAEPGREALNGATMLALGDATVESLAVELRGARAALECMAAGRPVIAVAKGALLDTITHGHDGLLVPENDVAAIGSGGNYALAAARALMDTDADAEAIARKAMGIAADICVYTNNNLTVESL